jgi:hypothetical protein
MDDDNNNDAWYNNLLAFCSYFITRMGGLGVNTSPKTNWNDTYVCFLPNASWWYMNKMSHRWEDEDNRIRGWKLTRYKIEKDGILVRLHIKYM